MIPIKRFLYYFVWTIVIGFIIYLGMKFQLQLEDTAEIEYNLLLVIIFTTVFPIVIGLLLRLPQLIIEIKENKKRTFDLLKFIAISLPTLSILIMSILPYAGIDPATNLFLIGGSTLTTIAGIVFRYILLDNFKKTVFNKRPLCRITYHYRAN